MSLIHEGAVAEIPRPAGEDAGLRDDAIVGARWSQGLRLALRLIAVFILLSSFDAVAQSAAEKELFVSLNKARVSQGLATLKWSDALADAARKHAGVMAQHGAAEHNFPGEPGMAARATRAGVHFSSLSEDVAQGPTAAEIHAEFMGSANHRANILDPDVDTVGVGVVERNGKLFAVEDFCKARP
jgi:uncharacterized protein YkwD